MGTEATKYFRFRCMECKEREDYETADQAIIAAADHNAVFHGKSKKAEIGRFISQHPQYWSFPA